ncbi:glutathionylspermidine synthase family protein [Cohnella lubricantis]|uniref:Glutathionylspermidine synthase family protein n=1 Tax=Cohnella lubricantis TaxID=2163172 RepID=A0A841TH44_9BACL|nr:glutathionylspermidine synthase family protein [Cohnella lubricantis]MBB6678578.1 glutathionylspermidine synthase family protein [Cohnella lubricantis]MBP2119112.1 glutathionylspermidine synthase [Cohnella lubricantis]
MTQNAFEVIGSPHQDRAGRVRELRELGFGWADLDEEPYWVDHLVVMDGGVYEELEQASSKLWHIFDKAARFVKGRRDLYEMIGIPQVLWESLDTLPLEPEGLISRYARFDWAVSGTGEIKLLELNSDTPTGYAEAAAATPWMCEQYGIRSANGGMAARIREAWSAWQPDAAACVAFGSHQEDTGTVELLMRHSGLSGVRGVDVLDLWVDDGVLKDKNGEEIRRLFALYPKEWMGIDDGGDALAYALEKERLTLFNSPHAVIMQSKGLQALIWGLYELQLVFEPEELETIGRHMLPTYNKALFDGSFVSKPMFGREGGAVSLFDDSGQLEHVDRDGYDTGRFFPMVYQKRAELAKIQLETGEYHLLTGMFVLNGVPCGLLGRAGGPITGNTSHFVAIGVK